MTRDALRSSIVKRCMFGSEFMALSRNDETVHVPPRIDHTCVSNLLFSKVKSAKGKEIVSQLKLLDLISV